METRKLLHFGLLTITAAIVLCVLGLYRPSAAADPETSQPNPPFANSVQQRAEMIEQLKAVVAELKEQNALLRSGKLKVLVSIDKQQDSP
jgi:hypothetical protein